MLKPLYEKRKTLLDRISDFWPTVFGNGPEEFQQVLTPSDLALVSAIKSFFVERYHIVSETEGEPRSLRFTFEFAENEFIEDTKLVKEFEYKPREEAPGNLVSKPVPIKWKGKKKDLTHGLLDAAVELYSAEEAVKLNRGDKEVEFVERESLWQYEKLREKISKLNEDMENELSFFNWFGFRGAVDAPGQREPSAGKENGAHGDDGEEEEDDDDDEDGMLAVEIFPAGDEIAIAMSEMWPDALDHFMSAQDEDSDEDGMGAFEGEDGFEDDDDDDAPELVSVGDVRPSKRQRKD